MDLFNVALRATRRPRRQGVISRAFTLIELLVVIAIIALLVAILLPALGEARCTAKAALNASNLNQYCTATHSYASEFQDRIWSFTWRAAAGAQPRNFRTQFADLQSPGEDVQAAHFQAVDIIRRRAPNHENFPQQDNWIPHILYSHLVLIDYLGGRLPEPIVRSPMDTLRASWAEDAIAAGNQLAAAGIAAPGNARWPYSSSYTISTATFTPDKFTSAGGELRSVSWNTFTYNPGTNSSYRLGNRRLSDVQFPGQKIHAYEYIDRTSCRQTRYVPYMHGSAKMTATSFDGHTKIHKAVDLQKGGYTRFNASATGGVEVAPIDYTPNTIIGDPLWIGNTAMANGRPPFARHTIGGLKGTDHGASRGIFANAPDAYTFP